MFIRRSVKDEGGTGQGALRLLWREPIQRKNGIVAAAKYPETFYGQMALEALGRRASRFNLNVPNISGPERVAFNRDGRVAAAKILSAAGQRKSTERFLLKLKDDATSAADYVLAAEVGRRIGLAPYCD